MKNRVGLGTIILLLSGLLLSAAGTPLLAQEYPTKPINLLIANTPAGSVNVSLRILAGHVEKGFGQPFVISNNNGGGGSVAFGIVAKQKPDGYKLVAGASTPLVRIPQLRQVPYKYDDFVPILHYGTMESGLFVRADAPWKTLKEFVEYAKKNPGKVTYLNDTKVFPARLLGTKESGGRVEVLLLERFPHQRSFWMALIHAAKKPRVGSHIRFGETMTAWIMGEMGRGRFGLEFHHAGEFGAQLEAFGEPPLPPYVRRQRDSARLDRERYQTVYAARAGAIAAPTAGFHFTPELFDQLRAQGIDRALLTLHVGPGTFNPFAQDGWRSTAWKGSYMFSPPRRRRRSRSWTWRAPMAPTSSCSRPGAPGPGRSPGSATRPRSSSRAAWSRSSSYDARRSRAPPSRRRDTDACSCPSTRPAGRSAPSPCPRRSRGPTRRRSSSRTSPRSPTSPARCPPRRTTGSFCWQVLWKRDCRNRPWIFTSWIWSQDDTSISPHRYYLGGRV